MCLLPPSIQYCFTHIFVYIIILRNLFFAKSIKKRWNGIKKALLLSGKNDWLIERCVCKFLVYLGNMKKVDIMNFALFLLNWRDPARKTMANCFSLFFVQKAEHSWQSTCWRVSPRGRPSPNQSLQEGLLWCRRWLGSINNDRLSEHHQIFQTLFRKKECF